MARFCPACGSQLEDNAMFCASCGAKIEPQPFTNNQYNNYGYQSHNNPAPKKKGIDAKTIILIAGAAILLIAMLITGLSIVFPGPKAVARRYTKAYLDGNAKKMINTMASFMWDNDPDEKKEGIDALEKIYDVYNFEDFDKVKFKVKEVNKLSKSERENLQEFLDAFDDADSVKIKNSKKVEVKVTITDGSETYRGTIEIFLVKYKGFWKVVYEEEDFDDDFYKAMYGDTFSDWID